jgi:polar amino acid transport system substrate-binding protein
VTPEIMYKILHRIFLASLLVVSTLLQANQELKIGVGNFPPFFVEEDQTGLFIEITEAVFEQLPEYKLTFVFMSNNRLLHEINYGKLIDIACNIFAGSQTKAHLSAPVFRYTDVAISKKSAQLNIKKITDLLPLSITAYQGAKELLGDEFKKMALANPNYSEHSQPKDSSHLLIIGRKDIRIGDIHIFWHDLKNNYYQKDMNNTASNFTIHRLWPDVYSHMAFKDMSLRNKVDNVIIALTANGTFEKIYAKYNM